MTTLHLVDGSGYIHRAFHAIRGLRTSRGLATNAVYGFATMLRKFARESRPELCAVVFDAGRETFRSQMYSDYKMNRPPPAEDLAVQFPYARRVAAALGFPIIEAPGFEADDVIATLVTRARAAGWRVVIDSADKDLFQLVSDGVTVWDPMRERTYDEAGVREKLGVAPSQVRDWLALVGDSSDNIPGVSGIGEKGATELIAAGGSLEGVYERLDTLTPRRREALVTHRESAFLSRDLATLRHDVPVDLELESLRPAAPDRRTLTDLLTELEFRSLLAEVVEEERRERASTPGGTAPVAGEPAAVVVGRDVAWEAALAEVSAAESPAVAAVFGTRDPSCPDCLAIGVATTPEHALVFPPTGAADAFLGGLALALARTTWRAANFKELFQVFAARGVELALPGLDPVIGNYVLHPERESQSLDSLALEALQLSLPPAKDAAPGAVAARACAVARVSAEVASGLEEAGLAAVVRDVEVPLARVLAEMEATGIAVDRGALSAMSVSLAGDLQAAEKRILEAAGTVFNPSSPKQLAEVLFGKLQLPVVRKTKTGPSTDVSVLEELSDRHPVPALILEYRGLAKLKSTYADALGALINPRTGRVHTSYNQTVTATGRLSSSDPNLQNIPIRTEAGRKIRSAFVAAPGHVLVGADYSQIELRVLAHLSGDEQLIDAFRRDLDIHSRTAARIFSVPESAVTSEQRRAAKVVNFGLLYGMGAFRLSRDLKVGMAEGQRIIDEYFGAFPAVRRYLDGTVEIARTHGYVSMLSGRRRPIEGIHSGNRNERAAAERMALNAPIQGTAADVIKIAMVRLRDVLRERGLPARMVLQVHDELVIEAEEAAADAVGAVLKDVMEGAMTLRVPLKVEVCRGRSWAEL